mgnify:CR=1 FL=1
MLAMQEARSKLSTVKNHEQYHRDIKKNIEEFIKTSEDFSSEKQALNFKDLLSK